MAELKHILAATDLSGPARHAVERAALVAAGSDAALARSKIETARFYFERILPRTSQHAAAIRSGSRSLMALDSDLF